MQKAFGQSLSLGVSTSLAILFHEIPHQIGDYAVLISSGLRLNISFILLMVKVNYTILKKLGFTHIQILVLNTLSSFCCLISFLIILSLEPSENSRQWIFSLTAGNNFKTYSWHIFHLKIFKCRESKLSLPFE
jgi:zinc transporter 12